MSPRHTPLAHSDSLSKEVRSEIHAVEDRLAELDFRLKRLEKRINI